jgi:polyphenol oxidase
MQIDILIEDNFPKDKLLSGVTKRNLNNFPPFGFSISNAKLYNDEQVIEFRKILARELNTDYENMAFQKQYHTKVVEEVRAGQRLYYSDGIVTNQKNVILNISIADCAAVHVYDPTNQCIGAAHSGWRGTQQNITKVMLDKINELYGSNPADLLVYISPSAGGELYEVGEEVATYFPNSSKPIGNGKYLFDNKKEIKSQLLSAGVLSENITVSAICTIANQDYHSFRRDKDLSGRMSSFIGLK